MLLLRRIVLPYKSTFDLHRKDLAVVPFISRDEQWRALFERREEARADSLPRREVGRYRQLFNCPPGAWTAFTCASTKMKTTNFRIGPCSFNNLMLEFHVL